MYYHPALLQEDETKLRQIFFHHESASQNLSNGLRAGAFLAYWPALYVLSRSVKPYGCAFFTLGYGLCYTQLLKPLSTYYMQKSINKDAAPFAEKYGVTADESKYYK